MGINRTYSDAEISRIFTGRIQILSQKLVERLNYIGLLCMQNIEQHRGYQDQTGNLRSSTGYVTAQNGRILHQGGFSQVLAGTAGSRTGAALAGTLAAEIADGYCLVVVAGMHYARHVGARGYNVLASAEILAERMARNILQQII